MPTHGHSVHHCQRFGGYTSPPLPPQPTPKAVARRRQVPHYCYSDLAEAMRTRRLSSIEDKEGRHYVGIIQGIRAESGDGRQWLVQIDGCEVYVIAT